MAIKERDVVLMGKAGADQTIDLPVTRLGLIEDGAEVKTALADADAVPVVDSADAQEMKKITWANMIAAIKAKLNSVYAAASHTHAWSAITGKPTSMTPTAHKDTHKTGGADALTAADVGAAAKSTLVSATISTTWTGSAAPWSQSISVAGVTATSVVEVFLPVTATAEQVEAYQSLNLQDGGQAVGSITLRAFGERNTISVPISVIVRGDM